MGGKGVSDRWKSRLVEKLGHTARMPSSSRCPGQEPRRGLADTVRRETLESGCARGRDWGE